MPINTQYDEEAVVRSISKALQDFYDSLLAKIDKLNLTDVLKKKNPYLYRAKAMREASDIVEAILSAFVSSSEETIFGNCFFEPIAKAVCGGNKALAEGIDIMIEDDENHVMHAIAVKSGPSVFNADSKKRQDQNFLAGRKLATQANLAYDALIGYSYGRKGKSTTGTPKIYRELAGQAFWYELTGDQDFYKKIIGYMGDLPEQYLAQYKESYAKAKNRLLKSFMADFCKEDGSIDWDKLVMFNSGSAPVRRPKFKKKQESENE